MKKILLIHQSSELYGSDRSFLSVAQIVCNLNYDVSILVPEQGPLTEKLKLLNAKLIIYDFGVLRKSKLKQKPIHEIFKILKGYYWSINQSKKFDIVYINTIVNITFILPLFNKKLKKIIHVRELPSTKAIAFFRFLFFLSKPRLIYNSKAVRDAFKRTGDVVYNASSIDIIKSKPKRSGINILFVGRINDWKGADLLLDAIINLDHLSLISNLYIVGSPYSGQEENLERLLTNSKALKNCKFHYMGFLENPSYHFSISDIVVIPSKKPEPFGRVVIESIAYGNITVIADHGGMTEIIEDNYNGFKFTPNSVEDLKRVILFIIERFDSLDYIKKNAIRSYNANFTPNILEKNITNFLKSL
ncbi:glycosyltransferase family 4 protein [Nitrincola nitratireducens]|uniref:Spore coat protein SA n=1 Tax=Nitrincola nitratireducens TaxID=1229521 RepID=W9UPL9_9GAMM|nr:glycosyltransferase family 4 protein [Nitrincola nitratireducens]EXJ09153.1 Spore coat protein SA [Nitrincola nitratireducens]